MKYSNHIKNNSSNYKNILELEKLSYLITIIHLNLLDELIDSHIKQYFIAQAAIEKKVCEDYIHDILKNTYASYQHNYKKLFKPNYELPQKYHFITEIFEYDNIENAMSKYGEYKIKLQQQMKILQEKKMELYNKDNAKHYNIMNTIMKTSGVLSVCSFAILICYTLLKKKIDKITKIFFAKFVIFSAFCCAAYHHCAKVKQQHISNIEKLATQKIKKSLLV